MAIITQIISDFFKQAQINVLSFGQYVKACGVGDTGNYSCNGRLFFYQP